ncbi:MAG: N-formylglutamate amidohydrolase [Promethearchaeota archaeon]
MFEIGNGNVPIVLSCPHGGFKKPKLIPDIKKGVKLSDRYTLYLARRIIHDLNIKNIKLYYIFSKAHRSKVDLNRPPGTSAAFDQSSEYAREIHYLFHDKIKNLAKKCIKLYNKCLFIDFHGFTKPHQEYQDIIFGNIFSNTLSIKLKNHTSEDPQFWGVKEFKTQFLNHFTIDDGLGVNDINIGYSGGYITHQFYRKENINAIQIEIADNIRKSIEISNLFVDDFIKAILNCLENINY